MNMAVKQIFIAVGLLTGVTLTVIPGFAQVLAAVQVPSKPLVLKAQGSFYVGGDAIEQTQAELGGFGPAGRIVVNQMYVRYMVPDSRVPKTPVVMIHGMTLTGKTWETTPDGRMGWDEYFVRKGHAVYVPDQVSRGRSGFNQAAFNEVRAGAKKASEQPPVVRMGEQGVWPNFRFGPKFDVAYPDSQFPTDAAGELARQSVPDLSGAVPSPNPNHRDLSILANDLHGAVLIGHSQGGAFPLEAALLAPGAVKGMILVEPGRCSADYTDEQIATLTHAPILIVFGDHLGDVPTGIPGFSWQGAYEGCKAFATRVNAAGGKAQMLYLPENGMRGNSHMLMQDKNNLQVADRILKWIDTNVDRAKPSDVSSRRERQ
jgi:pimeloyl-ACP methyl ester carboxylesterase